ncbi:MAG: acyl-ACP--UDP-N-acetylglucosamine O-acyltransferase [Candidatus Rokubacteria bacterium]|nr:acyl-ACP--UDP-N-acetylglucosamine O-acyltransferase [Candidatus Rokubacteria bacterium]MBI3105438.1 acyl-ACP--UDP-N-acetylglucosamine O-acyltransferase [Candidatus Rokubacteria bacterium]
MIHPAAHVDPRACLGSGVRVGPGTVIGPEVEVGDDTEIGAHAVLEGRVRIGARCRVGHGAILGAAPQDLKYRPGLPVGVSVGDGTVIREYVTIHHATREGHDTRIGSHCLLMASCHVAHDCVIGDHVIIINAAGLTGHVTVEDRATVGGLSGVHPFTRLGTFAYVGGCSKVTQDVPPFIVADGVPAVARTVNVVGMRRGGLDAGARRQAQEAFRILYRSGLATAAAAARLKAEMGDRPVVARMLEFIEGSRRGIVAGPARSAAAGGGGDEEATA